METYPFSLNERFIKRTLDIIGGSIGSLIFLVLLILLAPFYLFAPKYERGPILYTQKRFKKDGKEFQILKFRTMIVHDKSYWINHPEDYKAYRDNGNKLENDPRVTKIGKFIRCTSLDEIPQFVNVLIGDMSLVGPRPILEFEISEYGERINELWNTKPGITGYWTTHGRSKVLFPERAEMELKYNYVHCTLFDLKTILLTIEQVIFRKDAY